jgi:hypothetical protein
LQGGDFKPWTPAWSEVRPVRMTTILNAGAIGSTNRSRPVKLIAPVASVTVPAQLFGIEPVERYLGNQTVAYRNTQTGANMSAQMGTWMDDGSAGVATRSSRTEFRLAGSHIHLETTAKLLILLGRDSAVFSKCALDSLNNQADFDSAIRRFDPSRPSHLILLVKSPFLLLHFEWRDSAAR